MKTKNKKDNFFVELIFSKVFIILGSVFLLLLVYGVAKSMTANYLADNEIEKLEEQIAQIEGDNSDMNQFFQYLQTDDYVAREARTKLGLKKQGENLVLVKDEEVEKIKQIEQELQNQNQLENQNQSNIKKWIDYLFN